MSITTTTATYDGSRAPLVTASKEFDNVTGLTSYTATITIVGLEPIRTTTDEEALDGIESLDPPRVRAKTVQRLIDLAILACAESYDATEGLTLEPKIIAGLTYSVRYGVAGALRLLEVDA